MFPPVRTMPTAPATELGGVLEKRGKPGSARSLRHDLLDLEEEVDRLLERVFAHGDHVAHQRFDDGRRERAGDRHRDAFRNGRAPDRCVLAADRVRHRRVAGGLDAHDLDVGTQGVRRDCHPRDETAPTDGHHEHLDLGRVLEQLERDRAGTGDDRGVVVRRHEHESLLALEGPCDLG